MSTLILKTNRERSILRRHPWVFSGAVARVEAAPQPGATVTIRSSEGQFLAKAAYSPKSQIVARVWTWDEAEEIDATFFERTLAQAIRFRDPLRATTNAIRLVNAESDGLPGLIVDQYADVIVCQFLTAGADAWKETIADILAEQPGISSVYERSDVDVRGKEGLKASEGVMRGPTPPATIDVWEASPNGNRWQFSVDVLQGHKTGFYLDQRENRKVVAEFSSDKKVLNVFAYTGAFTVAAWQGGASAVTSIDSSGPALEIARRNLEQNDLSTDGLLEADAFKELRVYRDSGTTFDLIILDPPKFAHTEAQINKATRAYKDLNWLAFRLLNPGGHLITFSCSGLVSEDLFQKILFGAALDAGRNVQIIQRLSQATDHPILLTFPEAAYLKGFVCRAE
jgi:23S rRNA (cytosine1962-C5)-methyltransferase